MKKLIKNYYLLLKNNKNKIFPNSLQTITIILTFLALINSFFLLIDELNTNEDEIQPYFVFYTQNNNDSIYIIKNIGYNVYLTSLSSKVIISISHENTHDIFSTEPKKAFIYLDNYFNEINYLSFTKNIDHFELKKEKSNVNLSESINKIKKIAQDMNISIQINYIYYFDINYIDYKNDDCNTTLYISDKYYPLSENNITKISYKLKKDLSNTKSFSSEITTAEIIQILNYLSDK